MPFGKIALPDAIDEHGILSRDFVEMWGHVVRGGSETLSPRRTGAILDYVIVDRLPCIWRG